MLGSARAQTKSEIAQAALHARRAATAEKRWGSRRIGPRVRTEREPLARWVRRALSAGIEKIAIRGICSPPEQISGAEVIELGVFLREDANVVWNVITT